jgi:hypothetical protein
VRVSLFHPRMRIVKSLLSTLAMVALSSVSYAQNCTLCYTQAASAGSRVIQGLRSGILVLIIPPMFMSIGITVLAYRKRNQFSRTEPPAQDRHGTDW